MIRVTPVKDNLAAVPVGLAHSRMGPVCMPVCVCVLVHAFVHAGAYVLAHACMSVLVLGGRNSTHINKFPLPDHHPYYLGRINVYFIFYYITTYHWYIEVEIILIFIQYYSMKLL